MVDLHQVEPGLPTGHPWLAKSRWGVAWRTLLGVTLPLMAGVTFFGLLAWEPGTASLLTGFAPLILVGLPSLLCGVLMAILGSWLKRYYPFSQSLILGLIAVVTMFIVATLVGLALGLAQGPCPNDTYCEPPIFGGFWALLIYGLPMFLAASIGLGLAIWAATPRGTKVFWPVLGVVFAVFVTATVATAIAG